MNADLWLTSSDPEALWKSLPAISDRKARLWGAACCRLLVAPTTRTQRYEQFRNWLSAPGWPPIIEAAEEYADGVIDRATLRQTRKGIVSGGPHDVFRIVSGVTRFSSTAAFWTVNSNSGKFGAPSRDEMCGLMRDVLGNPFRPVVFELSWRTTDAVGLARAMYDSRNFSAMPILADALEDAGCDSGEVLAHCRGDGPHVRGCWVVDLVLTKS